jgi:hypothetical protein
MLMGNLKVWIKKNDNGAFVTSSRLKALTNTQEAYLLIRPNKMNTSKELPLFWKPILLDFSGRVTSAGISKVKVINFSSSVLHNPEYALNILHS